MKRLMFAGMIMMLALAGSARGEWELQYQAPGPENYLTDVCFVDENHGWVVGYHSTILATADGGGTWTKQTCPVDNYTIKGVEFIDDKSGFCFGDDLSEENPTYNDIVMRTRNGGETWEVCSPSDDTITHYYDISVLDEKTCWITAVTRNSKGKILFTNDGGVTWTCQYSSQHIPYQYFFWGIDFIDKNTGWALGSDYYDVGYSNIY